MGNNEFLNICTKMVKDYYKHIIDIDIYVVWSCKTLQNNKALLSTNIKGCAYFEITYNGDKKEFYFDAYYKEVNKCIKLESVEHV